MPKTDYRALTRTKSAPNMFYEFDKKIKSEPVAFTSNASTTCCIKPKLKENDGLSFAQNNNVSKYRSSYFQAMRNVKVALSFDGRVSLVTDPFVEINSPETLEYSIRYVYERLVNESHELDRYSPEAQKIRLEFFSMFISRKLLLSSLSTEIFSNFGLFKYSKHALEKKFKAGINKIISENNIAAQKSLTDLLNLISESRGYQEFAEKVVLPEHMLSAMNMTADEITKFFAVRFRGVQSNSYMQIEKIWMRAELTMMIDQCFKIFKIEPIPTPELISKMS